MTRLDQVKEILDRAVDGEVIGAHGAFWRNKTRDQFVQTRVFGRVLLVPGQPANSNILKALRGLPPFGSDVGAAGAIFRRMPAGRAAVAAEDIALIETWIADGCPDDQVPLPGGAVPQAAITDTQINEYFRALDSWALFDATQDVRDAVGDFFNAAPTWLAYARGTAGEAEWVSALADPAARAAVEVLGAGQEVLVGKYFGAPLRIEDLLTAYERFGEASLPTDPQRPDRPHQMDGASMWFFWLAFADAAERLGRAAAFWDAFTRAILLGMLHDGIFRGRFTVEGFTADDAGRAAMRTWVTGLGPADLAAAARQRYAQSGL